MRRIIESDSDESDDGSDGGGDGGGAEGADGDAGGADEKQEDVDELTRAVSAVKIAAAAPLTAAAVAPPPRLVLDIGQCASLHTELVKAGTREDAAALEAVLTRLRGADAKGKMQAVAASGLGKAVKKLTRHEGTKVAQAAAALCDHWRALAGIVPKAA